MDCISITDRTESMSLISQEKTEIAVNSPELFHLKKFVPILNSLIQEKYSNILLQKMSIPEKYQEEWWAGAISKVRKSVD